MRLVIPVTFHEEETEIPVTKSIQAGSIHFTGARTVTCRRCGTKSAANRKLVHDRNFIERCSNCDWRLAGPEMWDRL